MWAQFAELGVLGSALPEALRRRRRHGHRSRGRAGTGGGRARPGPGADHGARRARPGRERRPSRPPGRARGRHPDRGREPGRPARARRGAGRARAAADRGRLGRWSTRSGPASSSSTARPATCRARSPRSPSTASNRTSCCRASPTERVRDLAATLAAAEAAGVAAWCLRTASEYAKVREQFGRPIGSFQAVKHLCAEMLCRAEVAAAVAWDAAECAADAEQHPLAAAVAASIALDAAVENAKDCIQVLGGIGFTWEHDAHLYLRRAVALRHFLGGTGRVAAPGVRTDRRRAAPHAAGRSGGRPRPRRRPGDGRRRSRPPPTAGAALADSGYLVPHWPRPHGRGRVAGRAVADRRGTRPGRRHSPRPRHRRLGAADDRQARLGRADRAVRRAHAARRTRLVPAVQRARRRLGPRRPAHPRRTRGRRLAAHRPEGVDLAGAQRRLGRVPRPDEPGRARSTRASRTSWST